MDSDASESKALLSPNEDELYLKAYTNVNIWNLTDLELDSTSIQLGNKDVLKSGGLMWLPMSIFNLITTVVGAGLLSLPFSFSIGGVIPGAASLIFTTIVSLFSGLLIVDSLTYLPQSIRVFNYEDIAQFAFGRIGRVFVLLTIIVLLLPSHMAYMIITRDQLDLVIQFVLTQANVSTSEPSLGFYLTKHYIVQTIAYLPIIPICFLTSLRYLAYSSLFGFICILFVSGSFVYLSSYNLVHNSHNISITSFCGNITNGSTTNSVTCIPLWPNNVFEFLHSFTITALVFVCHFNILPLKAELYNPTTTRVKSSIIVTVLTAFLLYFITIIFTLLEFGYEIKADVMKNYDPNNILFVVGRIALFLSLLLSYPLLLFPCRAAIISLFIPLVQSRYSIRRWLLTQKYGKAPFHEKANFTVNTFIWVLLTVCIFLVAFVPTCFINNVDMVWGFVGAIGSSLVVFIWPCLFYLQTRRLYWKRLAQRKHFFGMKVVCSILLLIFGFIIMFVCTINQMLMLVIPSLF
ncbi:Sodium-coupled neutral amino acid transporter 6 [Oopsacas minuta]|uniref:Sodium-coupled neutral amino acid transporter 6 n=1 Tax=Oopsacas minuta TaxID=111878 RepID=A0AAV7KCS1_9METZ|nr:Sodium-coupled neutral amino acid transporter 6 [Oopsacas minuta]